MRDHFAGAGKMINKRIGGSHPRTQHCSHIVSNGRIHVPKHLHAALALQAKEERHYWVFVNGIGDKYDNWYKAWKNLLKK